MRDGTKGILHGDTNAAGAKREEGTPKTSAASGHVTPTFWTSEKVSLQVLKDG